MHSCAAGRGRERENEMAQPNRPVWRMQVGEEAPDFELEATGDTAGKGGPRKKVHLGDYRGKKNVVLAFYPAAFTPV
jgi:AhpC/TSA family protein